MEAKLFQEPTPTTVDLLPGERLLIREKAHLRAQRIGLRKMSLSNYMRWAALAVDVNQDAISQDETIRHEPHAMAAMEAA